MDENLDLILDAEIEKPVLPPFRTISAAFGLLGYLILFTIIVSIPIAIVQYFFPGFTSIYNSISYILIMGILLLFTIKKRKGFSFSWKKFPLLVLLLSIPAVLSLGFIIEPLANLIPIPELVKKLFDQMISRDVYSFITIAIAAPILEEFIFRGVVLEGMLKQYSPQKAIIWSSLIFGIFHLNPWQFIGAFFIGLLIGWVYYKTKSLWPCIFLHFVNNSVGFIIILYSKDITQSSINLFTSSTSYYITYGLCFPLFALSLYALIRVFGKARVNN